MAASSSTVSIPAITIAPVDTSSVMKPPLTATAMTTTSSVTKPPLTATAMTATRSTSCSDDDDDDNVVAPMHPSKDRAEQYHASTFSSEKDAEHYIRDAETNKKRKITKMQQWDDHTLVLVHITEKNASGSLYSVPRCRVPDFLLANPGTWAKNATVSQKEEYRKWLRTHKDKKFDRAWMRFHASDFSDILFVKGL
jgi:hypothetical protein